MIYLHDVSHSKYMHFHARNSKLDNIKHVIEAVMMHDDVNHTNHENRRWKSNLAKRDNGKVIFRKNYSIGDLIYI